MRVAAQINIGPLPPSQPGTVAPRRTDRRKMCASPRVEDQSRCVTRRIGLTVTISRLRRKLGDPPVITTPGAGYRIASQTAQDQAL
jgi:hypothetical protein